MNATHTFATLEISQSAYDEIHNALAEAGYEHAFIPGVLDDKRKPHEVIDMHGIGLVKRGD